MSSKATLCVCSVNLNSISLFEWLLENNSGGAQIRFSNLVTRSAAFQQNDQNGIYKFQQDLLPQFNQLAPEPFSGHRLRW